jgi:hypothetical protein
VEPSPQKEAALNLSGNMPIGVATKAKREKHRNVPIGQKFKSTKVPYYTIHSV